MNGIIFLCLIFSHNVSFFLLRFTLLPPTFEVKYAKLSWGHGEGWWCMFSCAHEKFIQLSGLHHFCSHCIYNASFLCGDMFLILLLPQYMKTSFYAYIEHVLYKYTRFFFGFCVCGERGWGIVCVCVHVLVCACI